MTRVKRSFQRANALSLAGPRAIVASATPQPARSRTPANQKGSDGDTLATPGATVGDDGAVPRGRRPIRNFQMKKPAAGFPGAGSILAMMDISR